MAYQSPDYYLRKAAAATPDIVPEPGHSGYFSSPTEGLDPDLFIGDRIRLDVREKIIAPLDAFFRQRGLSDWGRYTRVWLAGSGISYQWDADRGNGDLDVLIGIDAAELRRVAPPFQGLSDTEAADVLNSWLRRDLWPLTAQTRIGSKVYEVTYYWNPGVTDSPGAIRSIRPYAAYDLTTPGWVVRPPRLPSDPALLYPREWHQAIQREVQTAREILSRFNAARAQVLSTTGPAQTNALTRMRLAAAQAAALYDDIHMGRRAAFRQGGEGYRDWANFRWQSHKRYGTAQALAAVRRLADEASQQASAALYGGPVADAEAARIAALQWTNARGML